MANAPAARVRRRPQAGRACFDCLTGDCHPGYGPWPALVEELDGRNTNVPPTSGEPRRPVSSNHRPAARRHGPGRQYHGTSRGERRIVGGAGTRWAALLASGHRRRLRALFVFRAVGQTGRRRLAGTWWSHQVTRRQSGLDPPGFTARAIEEVIIRLSTVQGHRPLDRGDVLIVQSGASLCCRPCDISVQRGERVRMACGASDADGEGAQTARRPVSPLNS